MPLPGVGNDPFFSISGSDFVEMFVGVGVMLGDRRAGQEGTRIIFIDEIGTSG